MLYIRVLPLVSHKALPRDSRERVTWTNIASGVEPPIRKAESRNAQLAAVRTDQTD